MSRIEKGGTKFRPTLPKKVASVDKPRSSASSRANPTSVASSFVPPNSDSLRTEDASATNAEPRATGDSGESHATQETPATTGGKETQTSSIALPSISSLTTHADGAASTPLTSSSSRGNAISMPGQRKGPAPKAPAPLLVNTVTMNSQVDVENANRDIEAPAEVSSVVRSGRKRTAVEASDSVEPPTASPKRRRTKRSSANVRESSRGGKGRKTGQEATESQVTATHESQLDIQPSTQLTVHDASSDDDLPYHRRRKPRPRIDKVVLEVPEEGDPIDETTVTMMDLCNGMGQGRVSGRFLETFVKSNTDTRRKREDNAKLREITRRKELGLPLDDEDDNIVTERNGQESNPADLPAEGQSPSHQDNEESQASADRPANEAVEEDDEYGGVTNTSMRAPKVRYDQNGNLVLDETALEYDRQAEADAELAARGPMEVVIETDRDKFTNFASYAKKPRPDRWSKEETETFYLGLRMFHTGFDLIARLLPNRTRTMVRNKFKAEDKKNPLKITNLLSHKMRLPYDLDLLGRETGRDFSGPIPQVELPKLIEASREGESGEDDESVKRRTSTAPPSGGESDRAEATSVSTGRGRSITKGKSKRKGSKSTSKPPSTAAAAMAEPASSASGVGSTVEVEREVEYTSPEVMPRPPTIAVSKTFSRQGVPAIRAVGRTNT